MDEQSFADSLAAAFRTDEKIFQIDSRFAKPSGIVIEKKRKAGWLPLPFGDYDAEFGIFREAVADNVCGRSHCQLWRSLVFSKTTNEFKNQLNVGACGRAYGGHRRILAAPSRVFSLLQRSGFERFFCCALQRQDWARSSGGSEPHTSPRRQQQSGLRWRRDAACASPDCRIACRWPRSS